MHSISKVGNFAFYSRILVFIMQVLFNYIIPDHDARVFNPPNVYRQMPLDHIVEILFEGFRRWDGIYFHHIADNGYTYENTLAFFPLFPLTVRVLANTIFYPLQFVIHYGNVLTVSAFALNFLLFIKSAQIIYQLSLLVLKDETLAFKAAQLYCINPASIFFSAFYSETMFACLAFYGMLLMEKGRTLKGAFIFGVSALCRSNGLINIGFILYDKMINFINDMNSIRKARFVEKKSALFAVLISIYLYLGNLTLQPMLSVIPFLLYQYFAFSVFCNENASYKDIKTHILNYGNTQKYKMPHTGLSPWCHWSIPYSYSYVQSNHWDVGFMNYWEYKQIPNFLLAAPIIALSFGAIAFYVYHNFACCLSLGLYRRDMYKKTDTMIQNSGFNQHTLFPYVAQLLFLTLFGIFFMHIQVMTRFLCSSTPVIYWFIATITTAPDKLAPTSVNKLNVFAQMKSDTTKVKDSDSYDHTNTDDTSETADGTKANTDIKEENLNKSHKVKDAESSSKKEISLLDLDDLYDWDGNNWLHKIIFIYIHLYFFVGIAAFSNFLPWT